MPANGRLDLIRRLKDNTGTKQVRIMKQTAF